MKSVIKSTLALFFLCLLICSCEDKYAIKTVCKLPNNNYIIKQLKQENNLELFGIMTSTDSIIISPKFKSLEVLPEDSSILIGKLDRNDLYFLREDGSELFETWLSDGFSLKFYRYDDISKTFILKYKNYDSEYSLFHIGSLKGDMLYDAGKCLDLIFAKGLDGVYLERTRNGFSVIDINENSDINSKFDFIGGYAIRKKEPYFINLFNGETHQYNQIIDGNYIEYNDGVINLTNNKTIVKYVESNNTDSTEHKEILKKQDLWLKRKYVSKNQYGCVPYTLSKIVDDIPFYTFNFIEINIPSLYRPDNNGDMNISAYNLSKIEDVINYIHETGMYTTMGEGNEQPIQIQRKGDWGGSMRICLDNYFLKFCKIHPNGQYAFFDLNPDDYQFRFSTENFEKVIYEISVPENMVSHLPNMISLSPFTKKVGTEDIKTYKKRAYRPWMNKIWSDGTYVFRFDMSNVYIIKNGKYFNTTKYDYDPDYLGGQIGFEFEDKEMSSEYPTTYFSLLPSMDDIGDVKELFYEGGEGAKLFEVDVCDLGTSTPTDKSLIIPGTVKGLKGYEWLEGEWEYSGKTDFDFIDYAKVIITPKSYKIVVGLANECIKEISTAKEYTLSIGHYKSSIFSCENLSLSEENSDVIIDEKKKQIYIDLNQYNTISLRKIK